LFSVFVLTGDALVAAATFLHLVKMVGAAAMSPSFRRIMPAVADGLVLRRTCSVISSCSVDSDWVGDLALRWRLPRNARRTLRRLVCPYAHWRSLQYMVTFNALYYLCLFFSYFASRIATPCSFSPPLPARCACFCKLAYRISRLRHPALLSVLPVGRLDVFAAPARSAAKTFPYLSHIAVGAVGCAAHSQVLLCCEFPDGSVAVLRTAAALHAAVAPALPFAWTVYVLRTTQWMFLRFVPRCVLPLYGDAPPGSYGSFWRCNLGCDGLGRAWCDSH
jgi:hypothetical protein